MPDQATTADAQLILQLYELRRETEMRKARHWWVNNFWPLNAEDYMKTASAMGTQENNWLRQVGSYWSMAASFVLHGALNEQLFLQPSCSGEMFLVYSKVHPFIEDLRAKSGDPQMFSNIEKVISGSEWGRNRLQFTIKRIEAMRQKMAAAKS